MNLTVTIKDKFKPDYYNNKQLTLIKKMLNRQTDRPTTNTTTFTM